MGLRGLRVAYQPQVPALYDYLTVGEFLELAALLGAVPAGEKCQDVMRLFDLSAIAGQLLHTVSIGTRMKVALAAALVQNPELLVLDEPTNALDTIGVARLKDRLRELRAGGTTILLATHMIDYAGRLCDDLTILRNGRVQYTGPVASLGHPEEPLESRVLALIDDARTGADDDLPGDFRTS
jgi:ABC-2 type transport system ATP-binding protein